MVSTDRYQATSVWCTQAHGLTWTEIMPCDPLEHDVQILHEILKTVRRVSPAHPLMIEDEPRMKKMAWLNVQLIMHRFGQSVLNLVSLPCLSLFV